MRREAVWDDEALPRSTGEPGAVFFAECKDRAMYARDKALTASHKISHLL